MIETIWNKKVIVIVEMDKQDVADQFTPLPLLMSMYWNHYIGFYYQGIRNFFLAYAPFPFSQQQFHLLHKKSSQIIEPTQIISHLIASHQQKLDQPLKLLCRFRINTKSEKQSDLKRFYKNNLKASTALRYGKLGASMLTVKMSTSNVNNMYESYVRNQYMKYLGSEDYDSDDLGYSFLVHIGQKIPIRIFGDSFMMERAGRKQETFNQFLKNLFGEELLNEVKISLHGILLENKYEVMLQDLEKYCHPDGFLYFHIKLPLKDF